MALFGTRTRRRRERTIFLPWERRRLFGNVHLPRRRLRALAIALSIVALLAWVRGQDRHARSLRVTRNALRFTASAVDAYRADHLGKCPRDLEELTLVTDRASYLSHVPLDAWKRPVHLMCPSPDPSRSYELLSDGPDGEPFGLDRVE